MTSTSIAPQDHEQAAYERQQARKRWQEAHKNVDWHLVMHGLSGDSGLACDICKKLLNIEADLWDAYQGGNFTPPPFRLEWD